MTHECTFDAATAIAGLTPLPPLLHYFDRHAEVRRDVTEPGSSAVWQVSCYGNERLINIDAFPPESRELARHALAWTLRTHGPVTAHAMSQMLASVSLPGGRNFMLAPFELSLAELRGFWHQEVLSALMQRHQASNFHKLFLRFLCEHRLAGLGPHHLVYVANFRTVANRQYEAVISGEAILSPDEERTLVSYLDRLAASATEDDVDARELVDGALLATAFQFGVRSVQSSRLRGRDVMIRPDADDFPASVHLRYRRAKQKSALATVPMLRKMRADWCPIMIRLAQFRAEGNFEAMPGAVNDAWFGLTPARISERIGSITKKVLGTRRSALCLRHSAAQRLVDSGASHAELAAFLGHSSEQTGQVYFDASPCHAEIINKALAISPVYDRIAKACAGAFIGAEQVVAAPDHKQIGGVLNGTPISGIGLCAIGQPHCTLNPVFSCYGCSRFLPVRDVGRHQAVLDTLRSLATSFIPFAGFSGGLKPFGQLRQALAAAEHIVEDLTDPGVAR